MTAIGKLRHRLVLQEPLEVDDGAGGVTRTWSDAETLWAAIEPVSARARFTAGQAGQVITHRLILRSGVELTTTHRFKLGARIFEVREIRDADGEGRFLSVTTEEITP